MAQRKVVVIGLDSITPVMIEKFLAEGRMPNLQRLRSNGWSSTVTPTMPPTTPVGWATISTGAWPGTHGVEGFTTYKEGAPFNKKRYTCNSSAIRAECLWQTAERAGKHTILLKYPMSWPPTGGPNVVQVDGAAGWGGLKCLWNLVHSGCWDTADCSPVATKEETTGHEEWLARDQDNLYEEHVQKLLIQPVGDWTHLPAEFEPLWEAHMLLQAHGGDQKLPLYFLAVQVHGQYRLIMARSHNDEHITVLENGQWSDWLPVTLVTSSGERSGHVRLKVMAFDAPEKRLRLYQSQIHQSSGYTQPAPLAAELLQVAGPFVEWTESYDRLQGWIDDETQLEIYEQHVTWMSQAAEYLLQHYPWELFMTQVHFLDMAYHLYWGTVDPNHPQYDPQKAPFYWNLLGRAHELADQLIGNIARSVGEEACIIVLGDHGHDVYHSALMVNHQLLQEGFLTLYRDRRTGLPKIDWQHTAAYANGYRIHLNIAGRDPYGSAAMRDYATLQEKIILALYRIQDPRTGEHPIRMAIRREDAVSIGLHGHTTGDVIFATAPGYQARSSIQIDQQVWVGQQLQRRQIPLFRQTELLREFTGEHDTALPFTHAIHTMLFMSGPGIRTGRRQVPVRLVDIAPTICQYLGIPFPRQCEGSPIHDALFSLQEGE